MHTPKSNWPVSIGKSFVYKLHIYMKVSDYVDSAKYIVSGLFERDQQGMTFIVSGKKWFILKAVFHSSVSCTLCSRLHVSMYIESGTVSIVVT